jgi:hypothetical protein
MSKREDSHDLMFGECDRWNDRERWTSRISIPLLIHCGMTNYLYASKMSNVASDHEDSRLTFSNPDKHHWKYNRSNLLPIGRSSKTISFRVIKKSMTIFLLAPITCHDLRMTSPRDCADSLEHSWKYRSLDLSPVAIPPNSLLRILVKLAISLLMLSHEQSFDRGWENGAHSMSRIFSPAILVAECL